MRYYLRSMTEDFEKIKKNYDRWNPVVMEFMHLGRFLPDEITVYPCWESAGDGHIVLSVEICTWNMPTQVPGKLKKIDEIAEELSNAFISWYQAFIHDVLPERSFSEKQGTFRLSWPETEIGGLRIRVLLDRAPKNGCEIRKITVKREIFEAVGPECGPDLPGKK